MTTQARRKARDTGELFDICRVDETVEHFPVVCDCGNVLEADRDDAGGFLRCKCQRPVRVPRILKDTRELIRSLVLMGRLPMNDRCPYSCQPADLTVNLVVRPRDEDENATRAILTRLFVGVLLGLFMVSREAHGSSTGESSRTLAPVKLPIRIARSSMPHLLDAPQSSLIKLLDDIPIYSYLLDEYQSIDISVEEPKH